MTVSGGESSAARQYRFDRVALGRLLAPLETVFEAEGAPPPGYLAALSHPGD